MNRNDLVKFSVVIPTLNEERNIAALLGALQQQEYSSSWEIIVVDGGSTDATIQIVERVDGVRLVLSESGVSRQRNVGARSASGAVLIFMDADDQPPSNFLERVASSFRRFPYAVACPWFIAKDSGVAVRALYFLFNILFWLSQSTLRTGSGVCIITPKNVWERVGGFDETMHLGEDVKYIRSASPRFGLHRHLLIPLETSGRRFREKGAFKLMLFYARITPLILLGSWRRLQTFDYKAAPYNDL